MSLPKHMQPTPIQEIIADIRAVADHLGIAVANLGRDAYRECEAARFSPDRCKKHGGFAAVRAIAAGKVQAPPLNPQPDGHKLRGVSTFVDRNGEIRGQWIKTLEERESREALIERLLVEMPQRVAARAEPIHGPDPRALDDDLLALYPLGDPHIGMRAWSRECGDDFDLEIAERVFCGAIDSLASREPRAKQALIVNLGDFFHSDSQENRTRRSGHQLDVDGRWTKVLEVGLGIMVHMVDRCLMAHESVRVINEIGNHDDHSAIFLSLALNAHYRHQPRVMIDMSPARFHFHRFGSCLIGVTHGDGPKLEDLGEIMAADRPEEWGNTRHRFWYTGHVHHSQRRELRGCVVESFRTLASRDAWSTNSGYRAARDMCRIVLHREHGETERSIVSADYVKAQCLAAMGKAA